ncbi:hypothetical protein FACS1894170_06880 [Planctomycetales bacterium]|nr:hypothetical protein FACS1894170_06880 [Planctomycetales bacterium]
MSHVAETLPETILEQHVEKTGRSVKETDLLTAVLVLLCGLFILAMSAVFADHWFLQDGLTVFQRSGFCGVAVCLVAYFLFRVLLPLWHRQVNPLYSADLIEQTAPSLKNSLINWLLLRRERRESGTGINNPVAEKMYDGIVRTAEAKVAAIPADGVVNRNGVFWSSIALVILLSTFIGYIAVSPKSPLQTLYRVMLPFAAIERPQTVEFRSIKPGNTVMLQGERLTVSAEVFGQFDGNVYLVFSTKDGQAVDQRIPMSFDKDSLRYEADFPPGKQGFITDTQYHLEQGASRSRLFAIEVHPTATIEVTSVKYKYPPYTGLEEQTVTEHGDIRAVEGTEATVTIHSSLPLEEAKLVFDTGQEERMMIAAEKPNDASVRLELQRGKPQKTFSFSAKDTNGHDSRRSGIFHYEVLPDLPPKIQWSDTAEKLKNLAQVELAEDEALELPVQAEDPDFALRYLRFKVESGDKNIKPVDLIESPPSGATEHRGQITKTHHFVPKESRISAGETADIWIEATDTKFPGGNTAETTRIKVTVTKPKNEEKKQQEKQDKEKQKDEQNKQESKNDTQPKQPQDTGQNQNDGEKSKQQEEKKQPNQPESQQGAEQNAGDGNNGGNQHEPAQDNAKKDGNKSGGAGDKNADKNDGGKKADGQTDSGKKSEENANNQTEGVVDENDADGSRDDAGDKGGKNKGNNGDDKNKTAKPLNLDTQDGDVIEKIAEQMKEEGKLDDSKTENKQISEKRQRDDNLDPNSGEVDNKGNDKSNPKQRNNEAKAEQTQDQEQPGSSSKQGKETPDGEQSGQEKSSDSRQERGEMQQGAGTQKSSGQDGSEKQQGSAKGGEKNAAKKTGGAGGEQSNGSTANKHADANGNQPFGSENQSPLPGQQPTGGSGTNSFEQKTATDEANMEYADRVTNLVLEYLEDQLKDEPSDELLRKLGWTSEQLHRFYDKWKKMADESRDVSDPNKRTADWLEAVKSLGLKPDKADKGLQNSKTKTKDRENFTESQRFEPPDAVKDKFKRYTQGIGGARGE